MWQPAVKAIGKTTAQLEPGIRHSGGIKSVLKIIIANTTANESVNESQKRFKIRGPSMKKLDRSTSFLVACHCILYENKWASRAVERWIPRPPKKKKKNGIHLTFSKVAWNRFF